MPRMMYCWRCAQDMPMLDEDEWAVMAPYMGSVVSEIKAYRAEHGVTLAQAAGAGAPGQRRLSALEKFEELTGMALGNVNAIWHHRVASFGPPCTHCGRPLRTPRASHCAECGTLRPSAPETAPHP